MHMKRCFGWLCWTLIVAQTSAVAVEPAEIAVVTMAIGEQYREMVRLGLENKRLYCDQHGYQFVLSTESLDSSRPIVWSKIPLILETMADPLVQWVFWSDADSLVMNLAIPLEELIDERVNLIISKDYSAINNGQFLIRNCDWSRRFLESAYARVECLELQHQEQEAMWQEVHESHNLAFVKYIPQRLINSYAAEVHTPRLKMTYQPGDFILHFASVRGSRLQALLEQYQAQVVNDRDLVTLDQYLGIYGFELCPIHSGNNEGYMSAQIKEQFIQLLAAYPEIETIAEIGLNGGHSAEALMSSCPGFKRFVSFDLNSHRYTQPAVEYLRHKYRERFTFIAGDSQQTVPAFSKAHPQATFDLIYIDGGHHTSCALNDLRNCRRLAHSRTHLWIDDYNIPSVRQAIDQSVAAGLIAIDAFHSSTDKNHDHVWVEAHYVP